MIALIVITFYYQVALIEPLSDALVAIVARSDFANVAIILCHILSVKKTRLFVCLFFLSHTHTSHTCLRKVNCYDSRFEILGGV